MDIKREGKGSTDKLVEAFMKSEMKKNSSYNDLAKDARIDSGNRRNGGVSPDFSESEITLLKNPKKIAVFEGILSDDLPPLNSKIVRIFTSSTFTGMLLIHLSQTTRVFASLNYFVFSYTITYFDELSRLPYLTIWFEN